MAFSEVMHRCFRAFTAMIYPHICEVCGRALVEGENLLCLECLNAMPLCSFANLTDNEIHRKLMRVPVERAAALFYYYKDSPYADIIRNAKYSSRPSLARALGRLMAQRLALRGFFDTVDALTVVPLHKSKERRRGYNQSLIIARGVADVTGLPVVELLHCSRHGSQTARTLWERWLNARSTYSPRPDIQCPATHLLLVDDVITTGATLSACVTALHSAWPSKRVSVLSVGLAGFN